MENSEISWTDHTFNPWEGCTKVGLGCDHCYAEARNTRFNKGQAVNWGPGAPRRLTSAENWRKPKAWNDNALSFELEHGRRQRVFCASLADVFDNEVPPEWRVDLLALIRATPRLDWLLLTKRIGNVERMLIEAGGIAANRGDTLNASAALPPNVWLGATVVNQQEADRDIPKLLAVPARVRFLSMEPLLGLVDLRRHFGPNLAMTQPLIDWVIVGGESGHHARPMHPGWARSLRDQCAAAGVPFHFKQNGEWAHAEALADDSSVLPERWLRLDGSSPPSDGIDFFGGDEVVYRAGKKSAGRLLDGVEHNGFPGAR
jgi:protein gp37